MPCPTQLTIIFLCLIRLAFLSSPVSNRSFTIITAGHLNSKILFIANYKQEFLVYEYPLVALDTTAIRLHTNEFDPVPLANRWPILYHALRKMKVTTSITVTNQAGSEFIFAAGEHPADGPQSVFFGFNQNYNYVLSVLRPNGHIWLSSNDSDSFYVLKQEIANHSMAKYSFNDTRHNNESLVHSNVIDPISAFLVICSPDGQSIVLLNGKQCTKQINWQIKTGMVLLERFFLFAPRTVYSFHMVAFKKPGTRVRLIKTSLNAFFGQPETVDIDMTSKTTFKVFTKISRVERIAIVSLTSFLVILIIALLIIYACKARQKKKLAHHEGHVVEENHATVPKSTKKLEPPLSMTAAFVNLKVPSLKAVSKTNKPKKTTHKGKGAHLSTKGTTPLVSRQGLNVPRQVATGKVISTVKAISTAKNDLPVAAKVPERSSRRVKGQAIILVNPLPPLKHLSTTRSSSMTKHTEFKSAQQSSPLEDTHSKKTSMSRKSDA